MIPTKYANSLYFTPRTPWGTRVQSRALRNHMHASEDAPLATDKRPKSLPNTIQSPVGQAGLDQLQASANNAKMMDQNGVPRSLQSQISPERAEEITDPSRKPLPAPQIPSMTNRSFPLTQPLPEQVLLVPSGSGVPTPTSQQQGQALLSPSEADKVLKPKEPEKIFWDNPFKYKGWEVIPSVNPHGGGLQFRRPL